MARNNTVYLLIGQRGSGKSEYAQRLIENQSGISLVSRDRILIRFFGSTNMGHTREINILPKASWIVC